MYRLPDDFLGIAAHSESFNATTSDINLGVQASQAVGAQTFLAYVRPQGSGEGTFGYMFGQTPSASSNGPRLYLFDDSTNRRLVFQAHSSGTAAAPGRQANNNLYSNGQWVHFAGSWTGGLAQTGVTLYLGVSGAPLSEPSYLSGTDGTGSVDLGAANEFHIGNRAGTDRTFNGQIGYVARWSRVLSKQELLKAQVEGPESVPEGLILLWLGGEDHGPFGLTAKSTTAVVKGPVPPFMPIAAPAIYASEQSGVTINCGIGSATASGFSANISAGSTIDCGVGEATASGFAASIQTGVVIDCTVASADASGLAATVATDITISCALASATASGFTATIEVGATIDCGVGSSDAAGFVATVASSITIDCALAAATASGFAAEVQIIAIKDDYERSSVNLSGSSVSGVGDYAVIVIRPRVQESEVKSSLTAWLEPGAKITGINGVRPTFRFSDYASTWSDGKYHGVPWGASRRPMYSYDRLTWNYFDTQTIASSYIEFRHNTAFTQDTVYISRERQVSVTQTGDWIDSLAAAHPTLIIAPESAVAFTPTLTSWPAQDYIADEFSAQTNELGAAIPATPFYAFEINDTSLMPVTGVKRVAMMVSGVHAGEDTGNWAMMRAIEYLLGSSVEAQFVRRHFRVLVYPMVNAPGRYGGGWRGSFTQGTAGADDANRHFPETGSALQIVDKPKAAMNADRAGIVPTWVVDWHGQFEAPWGYFSDSPALVAFANVLSTEFGTTVTDMGGLHDSALTEYWRINQSSPMSITLEFGNNVQVSDATYEQFGTAFVASLETYFQYVDCSVGAAATSGFAAEISSPITISCSIGESAASGFMATISNSSAVDCTVGQASANGFQAEISSAITIDCGLAQVFASGYQAVVSSPITINASIGAAVAAGFTAGVTSPIIVDCGIGQAAAAGFAASFGDPSFISANLRYTIAQESRRFSISAESRNYTIKESA